jgi:hypothetical protein
MGSDITAYLERRDRDGRWRTVHPISLIRTNRQSRAALDTMLALDDEHFPKVLTGSYARAFRLQPITLKLQYARQVLLQLDIGRNYHLFYHLAGIRGGGREDVKRISNARGIPDNASRITRNRLKSNELHSHSWVGMWELSQPSYYQRYLHDPDFGALFSYIHTYDSLGHLRMVFGFDN